MKILDGKATSTAIKKELKQEVDALRSENKRVPHLAAIIVGRDGASLTYVGSKVRSCKEIGYASSLVELPEETTQDQLLKEVDKLNRDENVDGFIVQLPLPEHIDAQTVLEAIDPRKDVDGFHPENVGRMVLGLPTFLPATPYGIIQLIERHQIETSGKHCVVVGRSNIVGSPMSILMARNAYPGNCTVTLTHSRTKNLEAICREADILIVALGRAEFITASMVKEGAVVIDVGITRIDDPSKKSGYRLAGDVNYDEVAPKCSYITPVPGGVGPMTIASLLMNTMQACKNR